MRHASLVLALAFAFIASACGSSRHTGGQEDAGVQQDGNHQFDVLQEDVAVQQDVAIQQDAPPANYDSGQSLVKCGTTYCNLAAGEECCVTGTTMDCAAAGSCSGGYGTLACDGPEDCFSSPTPVCCGRVGTGGATATCESATACTGNGAMTLCHDDATCGSGNKCCGALTLGGLDIRYCLPEASCNSTPTEGVPCGSTTCNLGDACCMTMSGGTCGTAASCTAGIPLLCDGPEDCQQDGGTGQVCCVDVIYSGGISGGSSCVTTCQPAGIFGGVMCHSNDDCQSPKTCKTVGYSTISFHVCQ
jgi:hypothetical protein